MSNYILTADGKLYHCDLSETELYHYGVPGMKWGVRRAQKKEYRKGRRLVMDEAYDSGRWQKIYEKKYNRSNKKLNKRIARDEKKRGELSEKTKKQMIENEQLKRDYDAATRKHRANIKKAQKYIDDSAKKYEGVKVKDVKMKTAKNGETYVKSFFTARRVNKTVGKRRLVKRDYVDSNSNVTSRYEAQSYNKKDKVLTRYS